MMKVRELYEALRILGAFDDGGEREVVLDVADVPGQEVWGVESVHLVDLPDGIVSLRPGERPS